MSPSWFWYSMAGSIGGKPVVVTRCESGPPAGAGVNQPTLGCSSWLPASSYLSSDGTVIPLAASNSSNFSEGSVCGPCRGSFDDAGYHWSLTPGVKDPPVPAQALDARPRGCPWCTRLDRRDYRGILCACCPWTAPGKTGWLREMGQNCPTTGGTGHYGGPT